MDAEGQEILREQILETVENQLRDGDPPEARRALRRLVKEGWSDSDAKTLICRVLFSEMFEVIRDQRGHDPERYAQGLNALPEFIYEEEDDEDEDPPPGPRSAAGAR